MTILDYLNLLTSEYAQQPNFTAVCSLNASILVQIQEVLASMVPLFDLNQAIGNQLDIIGQWVGVSRNVAIPISGVYFTWDGAPSLGWDYGTWQPFNAPTEVTVLPDDAYLLLIKAKIAANSWNGTLEGAYAIWSILFTTTSILIQDNQDMTYNLCVVGGIIDSLSLALITGGYIPLKPEGVAVYEYFISPDTNPLFAWDCESEYLAGWDEGSWAIEVFA